MNPYENFVAELLAAQVPVAEYAADHDGWIVGEVTYWQGALGKNPRPLSKSDMRTARDEARKEFEWWLNPDNPQGAVMLAEMAGMSDMTIEVYCQTIRARLCGDVRTGEFEKADGYVGVYLNGRHWFGRVQSKALGIRRETVRCDTELEAMLAREAMIEENGWTWATRNGGER
jgi:hypothetical protein